MNYSNMDNRSQHSKHGLPNTSRVCGKILEYYHKYGKERDLEKFMRLYSPVSSQDSEQAQGDDYASTKTFCMRTKSRDPISSSNSCEIIAMIPSRPLSVRGDANSKSLPNIDIQGQIVGKDVNTASSDVIVDINIEADVEKEKVLSISTENLKTPKKVFRSTKTQTPESVAKTHRRLEWDSLGDVGYKKSLSTSNISIIERSLLKEFFKEKSVVSEPRYAAPKEDYNFKVDELKSEQKLKKSVVEHSTPPLACSTLVYTVDNGAKPKMLSQSTSSTSLNEKFEKYAQTSIVKPPSVRSQEVQCTLSSSYSIVEGTATPSSFENYSSRSSKSSDILNANRRKQLKPQEHPFITSITDLLMKRKPFGEKNQQERHQLNNIKVLQTKFQVALDENKENQTHSTVESSSATSYSLSKHAPELDLGIQLVCSLIDAKSINGRQKKHLIRDIIKRLTRIEGEDKTSSTTANSSEDADNSIRGTTTNSSNTHYQNVYDSVDSGSNRNQQRSLIKSVELGVSPLKAELMMNKKDKPHPRNTTEVFNGILANKLPKNQLNSRSQNFPETCFMKQQDKSSYEHFPVKRNHNASIQNNIRVSSAAATKINKETQSESIKRKQKTNENGQIASNCKLAPVLIETQCLKTNRCTQTSKASSTSTTSATTTPDLTTQKLKTTTNPELNNSNTDAEQPTMRDWLNPLTQSEIEYEEKKQIEIKKKAALQAKLMKKSKHDCGRVQQLSWIENEIKRLECLKHLLLKDETSTSTSSFDNSLQKNSTKNSNQTEKLYDTVYTDKSSVLSESAEQLVQEIEIILEESHENVINFKDNYKLSKDRNKETNIMYEKDSLNQKSIIKAKPNIHEEQLFEQKKAAISGKEQKQREKIDTPSTDVSKESKSLKDMVEQRKREFMEAYKSKKQHHYAALKQHQKRDFKYLNLPQKLNEKSTTTDSEHYSVPHTIPRKFAFSDVAYNPQQILPMTQKEKEDKHEIKSQQQSSKPKTKEESSAKSVNANNYTTTSSSSMFCISSDISVPMGSQNTFSSPISTHQYNDKATLVSKTGVAVQTSDSMRFSKPIFGPKPLDPIFIPHNPTTFSSTACIQVKPKGIAYVIEFDDIKQATSNSASDTDVNVNDLCTKSNEKSQHSSTKQTTNNLKSALENDQVLTLQEHLEKSKPKFLKRYKERKAILNQLQSMRQERGRQLREIIENSSLNSLDRRLQYLPPPPIQKVRILKTKEMKALTNKRFASLPEIVAKQEREIEERKRRSNRILRDVFNKRLQKRVRSGKLSLNHSKTVI